uniref:Uncharacterized protein LOC102804628 n=1 Tax=Saccoglossus kowalevskii TaxID=10224 RepID=A0ABM0MA56_SACKO
MWLILALYICKVPSMPLDVRAEMRTAIAANITWLAPMEPRGPLDEIQYELLYSTDGSSWSIITSNIGHTVERYYIYLYNLQPAMPYTFKVRAYPALHDEYTESLHVENTTFQVPGPVTLLSKTDTTLNISWTSPTDGSVNLHVFKYQKPGEVLWQTQILPGGITESNVTYYELIGSDKPLQPKTLYRVQVAIIYHSHEDFEWPEHFRSFETL